MSVIVTNASSVKALVVTRSLGRKGIDVITTDSERFSPTFFSKYSKSHFLTPSAERSPNKFINVLLDYVRKNKPEVLMPVNSTETLLISRFKNRFTKFTEVPFENYSKMILLHDKEKLAKVAAELDLPIPQTYTIEDINEVRKIAEILEYPVVIKLKGATSSKGISYAYSKEEFISKYKRTIMKYNLNHGEYPIVQEYIPGDGYGVSLLFNHGDLRAIFVHKRLREFPLSGGPSTLRISTRHPEMEKIAVRLLEEVEWHGLAMVEFKLDARTNKPVLIEVNPRFWGSINQAVSSGVDFPYLLYKMAVEGDVEPVMKYKLNVITKYFMNDLRAVFSIILKRKFNMLKYILRVDSIDEIALDDILPALIFPYIGIKEFIASARNKFGELK